MTKHESHNLKFTDDTAVSTILGVLRNLYI